MANLHELKKMMGSVPDHKMHHDTPMNQKHEMANKMKNPEGKTILKKPRMLSKDESEAKMKKLFHGSGTPGNHPSEKESHDHQRRIGRAYND
jgi:hypothetical protein